MSSSKPPKKSEMLEVRLSYEDKQKLQAKAKHDGQSVSQIVRGLITSYLNAPESRSFGKQLLEFFMLLKSFLARPKTALASLSLLFVTSLTVAPFSHATEIGLSIEGYLKKTQTDEQPLRTFETEIITDIGKTVEFNIDGTEGSVSLSITVIETKDGIIIDTKISDQYGDEKRFLGNPKLSAKFDESANLQINSEYQSEPGHFTPGHYVSLSFTPTRKQ